MTFRDYIEKLDNDKKLRKVDIEVSEFADAGKHRAGVAVKLEDHHIRPATAVEPGERGR